MLLQKLAEYAERTETAKAPILYAEGPLRYTIDLGPDGQFLGLIDHSDPSSRSTRRGLRRLLPQVQRTSAIRPLLLADKAEYTLGLPKNEVKAKRAQDCHAAYMELVKRCAIETEERDVQAVLTFLLNRPLEQLPLDDSFVLDDIMTFRIGERHVIDIPAVQNFWASINQPDKTTMQCLVCGNRRPALKRLQSKIKGIPGGQTSGTSIISANSDAFESYGLSKSQTAPTCSECAESFTRSINALLSSETNRFRIGNGIFVFWTRETQEFDFLSMMSAPEAQDVLALLESVRNGSWSDMDETVYYALSLSAAGSRAVVRDWMDTTVKNVKENLALWFQRQWIVDEEIRYHGLQSLATATVRKAKDLPVTTSRALIWSAFKAEPVPVHILHQAVRRCQAERRVTRPRAALIKLALLSQPTAMKFQEDYMVGLDTSEMDAGYLCGRLMAELQNAQREAREYKINTTVTDKYYGTASTAPASVFPKLLKSFQNDLRKIRRDTPGAGNAIELRIMEITDRIDAFPSRLNVKQQGMFALGYFHQRSEAFRQINESRHNKQTDSKESS